MTPMPVGIVGSAHVAASEGPITFSTRVLASNVATKTFTSVPLGEPSSSRVLIILALMTRYSFVSAYSPVTSITVGGVPATLDLAPTGGNAGWGALARLAYPDDTNADIVVTCGNSEVGHWALAVARLEGTVAPVSLLRTDLWGTNTGRESIDSVAGGFGITGYSAWTADPIVWDDATQVGAPWNTHGLFGWKEDTADTTWASGASGRLTNSQGLKLSGAYSIGA